MSQSRDLDMLTGTSLSSVTLDPLGHKSGPIWHLMVPWATEPTAVCYAGCVDGPRDPSAGQLFGTVRSVRRQTQGRHGWFCGTPWGGAGAANSDFSQPDSWFWCRGAVGGGG